MFKKRGNNLYYIIVSYLHTIYNYNTVIYYINNNNNNNIQAITNSLNIYDCYVTWQTSNDLAFPTLFNMLLLRGATVWKYYNTLLNCQPSVLSALIQIGTVRELNSVSYFTLLSHNTV